MWYNVDFKRLGILLLPILLRKPKIITLLNSLLSPLITNHYDYIQNRNSNLYKLQHNGQVCYLRKALNDTFDPDKRRIYIDGSGGAESQTYIYTSPENQPKYLGTIFLRQSLEFADTGADFIVYVPASIAVTQNYELRALIDFYKLGGKRYLISKING